MAPRIDEIIAETREVYRELHRHMLPPVIGGGGGIEDAIIEVAAKLPLAQVQDYLAVYQQVQKEHLPAAKDVLVRVAYDIYRRSNERTS